MSGITRENLNGELHYFTGVTGVPDDLAVEYFADSGVYVHTRDGKTWQRGVCVSPAEEIMRLYGVRVVKANPVVLNREMRRLRQRRKEKMLFTPSLNTIMDKLLSERTKRGRKKVYDTYKGMHELGHLDKQTFSLLHEVFSSEEAEKAYRDRGLQGLLIHMGYKAVNWSGMLTLVPPGGNAMDGWTFGPIALYEVQRKWRDEIMKNLEASHENSNSRLGAE